MKTIDANPVIWSHDKKILFDNNVESFIFARYKGGKHFSLAHRWNGEGDSLGYPSSRGYPTFHALYEATGTILKWLLEITSKDPAQQQYRENVEEALKIWQEQSLEDEVERRLQERMQEEREAIRKELERENQKNDKSHS